MYVLEVNIMTLIHTLMFVQCILFIHSSNNYAITFNILLLRIFFIYQKI
jgi:hypothetical protein